MASLYRKDNGIYMLAVCFQKKRVIRSLGTKSKEEATHAATSMEKEILREILNGRGRRNIPFNELVGLYLKADHGWKESTKEINTRMLGNYLKRGLPENKTSRALTIRIINGCNRWGKKMKHLDEYSKMNGGSDYEPRIRVYTKNELELMFEEVTPMHFNQFIRFAYYTGCRSGEIRRLPRVEKFFDHIIVRGKSGRRIVKLASQAREVLDQDPNWDYTANYVQLTWSRNRKRLGLKDARLHDLRRTFGYNLIMQGRPIYEVSKLLGHSSVTTTERHYAPLLTTEIEDFIL